MHGATFECHWDLLLRECAKRREKETQVRQKNFYLNAYCPQTKRQLQQDITGLLNFMNTKNRIGPVNDENKLQVDEKENNKN